MITFSRAALAASLAPALLLMAPLAPTGAIAGETPSPDGARVYIVNIKNGDTITGPVTIVFGLDGMGVAPAGIEVENTGHHHLLINYELTDEDMEFGIPATDNSVHFGGGQTQTTMDLPTGTHTLQLVLGDFAHIPHDPPVMSDPITVTVK
ncbi:MAG: DUF4399 domain-containing protein [Pseudomonadota bacterium]